MFMLNLEKDIYVKDVDLWLDPKVKKPFSFVSHGHSDHLRRHERVLVSERTALFYTHTFKKGEVVAKSFNEPFAINGCTVELFPSGHMLGASQILIEHEERVVYTGDFKIEKGNTAEQAHIKMCDILIMECTYGHPKYIFPPREEMNDEIFRFAEKCLNDGIVPVLFAYRMGKAQEVMKLLGDRDLPLAVPKTVYEMEPVQHFNLQDCNRLQMVFLESNPKSIPIRHFKVVSRCKSEKSNPKISAQKSESNPTFSPVLIAYEIS